MWLVFPAIIGTGFTMAMSGETVAITLRRLRLAAPLIRLANSDMLISRCGIWHNTVSQDAFSRAFREASGKAPVLPSKRQPRRL